MKRPMSRRAFVAGSAAVAAGVVIRGTQAQGTPSPLGQNPVGSPVTIYDELGNEKAQITVTEFVDPFMDWSDYGAPQRGERFVLATIQIEATGTRPLEVSSYDFQLLDDQGIVYSYGYVSRSDASMVSHPDLEDADMLPGEIITGSIAMNIPEVVKLSQVIYSGYGDNNDFLYLLANVAPAS